jgi:hypothetical protein
MRLDTLGRRKDLEAEELDEKSQGAPRQPSRK